MQQPNNNPSSKKENKKVQTKKQFDDNKIEEGKDFSIRDENAAIEESKPLKKDEENFKEESK